MAVIKPTLTIVSNKSSATLNPGPLSVGITLAATDTLTVDTVQSEVYSGTIGTGDPVKILDGSVITGTDFTGGTHGGFVYIKNITASGTDKIHVGIVPAGNSATPAAPATAATGTGLRNADDESFRTFTLLAGEFAYFPWDYLGDIYVQGSAASQSLEYWLFDRG